LILPKICCFCRFGAPNLFVRIKEASDYKYFGNTGPQERFNTCLEEVLSGSQNKELKSRFSIKKYERAVSGVFCRISNSNSVFYARSFGKKQSRTFLSVQSNKFLLVLASIGVFLFGPLREPRPKFLFVQIPFMCLDMGSRTRGGIGFSEWEPFLWDRNLSRVCPHSRSAQGRTLILYGHHTRRVTLPQWITFMQGIHRSCVNANFRSRLCLDLFYHSETVVTWMILGLITTKFNPLVRPTHGSFLSNFLYIWAPIFLKSRSKLCYDRRSADQSVVEQSTHLGLTTRSWLLSDICGFVDLGRPLWREDGSAVWSCYWSSPAQSFLDPSIVGLVAIFYCRLFSFHYVLSTWYDTDRIENITPNISSTQNYWVFVLCT
jgi:hypothetical protein